MFLKCYHFTWYFFHLALLTLLIVLGIVCKNHDSSARIGEYKKDLRWRISSESNIQFEVKAIHPIRGKALFKDEILRNIYDLFTVTCVTAGKLYYINNN